MRPENQRMKDFLRQNGVKAIPKFFWYGSLKTHWRLDGGDGRRWTTADAEQLNKLGFTNLSGAPLNEYDGNGGRYSVIVRGHLELIEGVQAPHNSTLSAWIAAQLSPR